MDFRKNKVSFVVFLSVGLALIVLNSYPYLFRSHTSVSKSPEEIVAQLPPAPPEVMVFEDSFADSSTAQDILLKYDFTPQEAQRLIDESRPVYDLNRVMAGNRVHLEFADKEFRSLRYEISDEEYLTITYENGAYVARRWSYEFETRIEEFYGRIDGSLWNTLISQGEESGLVVELINLLQWDVPFTSIQPGDSFKLIVEKKYRDGRFVKYGQIHAVEFRSGGKTFYAFRFEDPATGKIQYFDEQGRSVRKAFLKVPFRFSPRITSRYSRSRYHPILKRRRPHLGVDFGAPYGTSVLASASGSVIFAGVQSGYGKVVKIRHAGGVITSYGHLSRISVRVGQSVAQMDMIGRVGSTGLSTGPHLDYRIQDSTGRFLNPLRSLASLPAEQPVSAKHMPAFAKIRDAFNTRLAAIPEARPFFTRVASAG